MLTFTELTLRASTADVVQVDGTLGRTKVSPVSECSGGGSKEEGEGGGPGGGEGRNIMVLHATLDHTHLL